VRMPVTMRAAFDKHLIEVLGNFVADGELVGDDGRHSCTAVTIECCKKANLCAMVDVQLVKIGDHWEIVSIVPQMELPISTWNGRFIISAGDSNLCNRREVTVDIEKQRIRVVQTSSCDPSVPAVTYYIEPPARRP